ncbi:LuxR family transcriptional regulator [Limoniibacter endophyticus]|uniref:LuxR family transcriptional regulator n=1 Tax=Limoniibacter endophyticus TaxID=1565040 RepID=A0A8J3DM72_9HYPH|nr:LuxR family transcriptional regulator [Limoniibacter endophyticus]GHC69729.1 LuxR family transcriptional regulator [Limoniibacter endophyticus]
MPVQNFANDVLAFVTASSSVSTERELNEKFTSLLHKNSFNSFIVSDLKRSGAEISTQVILNQWPERWTERYIDQNYFQVDPVSQNALVSEVPFTWNSVKNTHFGNKAERIKRTALQKESEALGMADGITIPLRDTKWGKRVVSLATEAPLINETNTVAMAYLAASYFNLALSRLQQTAARTAADQANRQISGREMEILTWIALGKTSWETSVILGISERTVHVHLSTIRGKLNVSTTTQAVAIALLNGYINL